MRRASREINTLSLSALDLFATAMGAFAIIMLILFPHYKPVQQTPPTPPTPTADQPYTNSLGMKFVPIPREHSAPAATLPATEKEPSAQ